MLAAATTSHIAPSPNAARVCSPATGVRELPIQVPAVAVPRYAPSSPGGAIRATIASDAGAQSISPTTNAPITSRTTGTVAVSVSTRKGRPISGTASPSFGPKPIPAVGTLPVLLRRQVGDERALRRPAERLDEAHHDQHAEGREPPETGDEQERRGERLHDRGGDDQRPAPEPVGETAPEDRAERGGERRARVREPDLRLRRVQLLERPDREEREERILADDAEDDGREDRPQRGVDLVAEDSPEHRRQPARGRAITPMPISARTYTLW